MLNSNEGVNSKIPKGLILYAEDVSLKERAVEIAKELNIDIAWEKYNTNSENLALKLDEKGLALVRGELVLQGDLVHMLPRLKQNNLNRELLVKAAKIKNAQGELFAIDATAGLGEDSILLAAAGFEVWLYEYDPVIAILLEDALERAKENPNLSETVSRMKLKKTDSIDALGKLEKLPDVVLLDPMFPERQKSALVKKKFQLLQQLECPCTDENELLQAAISAEPRKVIIKRPVKGPKLAGRKPDYSISGKAVRYDCIVIPRG